MNMPAENKTDQGSVLHFAIHVMYRCKQVLLFFSFSKFFQGAKRVCMHENTYYHHIIRAGAAFLVDAQCRLTCSRCSG